MSQLSDLRRELDRAGYYPELVSDIVDIAVAGETLLAFLVHPETTFDAVEVKRHVTVLVLTPSRLVIAHVDDNTGDMQGQGRAAATTESVPISRIRTVLLTHIVEDPAAYRRGKAPLEITLGIGWGAVSRVDMEPASCPDPRCEADHGMTGSVQPDDLVIRVSAEAEGHDAVEAAVGFARALSAATATVGIPARAPHGEITPTVVASQPPSAGLRLRRR